MLNQGITASELGLLFALLTAWSFVIGAIIEGIKRAASSACKGTPPKMLVRLLPLMSMLLGALSGFMVLGLIFSLVGIELAEEHRWLLPYTGSFIGLGAGAVAGQVVKTYKQTLLGQDARLNKGGDDVL